MLGTGRAKHSGNDFLVNSQVYLPNASPLRPLVQFFLEIALV